MPVERKGKGQVDGLVPAFYLTLSKTREVAMLRTIPRGEGPGGGAPGHLPLAQQERGTNWNLEHD